MKKLLLLLLIFCGFKGFSQKNDPNYFGLIKLYPLNLISGHYNAGYEYIINSHSSIELNGSYYFQDLFFDRFDDWYLRRTDAKGFAATLTYRGYLSNSAPSKSYLAPQIKFKSVTTEAFERNWGVTLDSVIFHRNVYTLSLLAGYQQKIFKNIFIDIYLGGGFKMVSGWIDAYYEALFNPQLFDFVKQEPSGKSVMQIDQYLPLTVHLGINLSIAI